MDALDGVGIVRPQLGPAQVEGLPQQLLALVVEAELDIDGADRVHHLGAHPRLVVESGLDLLGTAVEQLAGGDRVAARLGGIRDLEQVDQERGDAPRGFGLEVGSVALAGDAPGLESHGDGEGEDHEPDQARDPSPPARPLQGATVGFRALRGDPVRLPLAAAFLDRAQDPGDLARRGQPVLGAAVDEGGDVVAQQRVVDVPLPARRHGAREVADDELVDEDPERVDVGLGRRRPALEHFRRHVDAGSGRLGARRTVRLGHAQDGDPEVRQARAVGDQPDAEVGHPDPGSPVGVLLHEDVARLDVLVQDADGVRRGDGVGDLGGELEAGRHRDLLEASARLDPLRQVAALRVLELEEVGRLVEVPVEDARDVLPVAERFAQQPAHRDLALQRAHALELEAELEHPRLVRLAVARQPDLAETALAELLVELPVGALGHALAGRRAPSQDGVLGAETARLLGGRRRQQGGAALDADLEDFDRLVDPLELVGAVGQPVQVLTESLDPGRGAAGEVEGAAGQQRLSAAGERHEPRRDRLGQSFDLDRLGTLGDLLGRVLAQEDFADVDADARLEEHPFIGGEPGQRWMVGEREGDRVDRPLEEQQESVGLVDLAPLVALEQAAGEPIVPRGELGRALVSQAFDEQRRVDQVGDDEGLEGRRPGGGGRAARAHAVAWSASSIRSSQARRPRPPRLAR